MPVQPVVLEKRCDFRMGEKDVFINEAFSITWDNRFYRNPPPGFSGPEQIRLLLGSAKRVTD